MNYFENYSDNELIEIVNSFDKTTHVPDSNIRQITADIFGTFTPVNALMLGVPLSKELAKRMIAYSPHVTSPDNINLP